METPEPSYCLIPLTRGQFAKVDAVDFDWLNENKWFASWSEDTRTFYAVRNEKVPGTRRNNHFKMHREILGLKRGDRRRGDHWSGDTLDNRRGNLRIATIAQNNANCKTNSRNSSGFKGVHHHSSGNWHARISFEGKRIFLGAFDTRLKAIAARKAGEIRYFGEFARTVIRLSACAE